MIPFTRPMYSAVLVATLVLAPAVARATFHENVIDEVMSGFNGDPTFEYVELRADAPGQNFVNTARLVVFDSTGTRTDLVVSGNDVANGLDFSCVCRVLDAFFTLRFLAGRRGGDRREGVESDRLELGAHPTGAWFDLRGRAEQGVRGNG